MALAIINALADVSPALQTEYVPITEGKHKGKFMLKVDAVDGYSLEDATGLKSSLSAARVERDEARGVAAQFKDIDPKAAKEALEKVKNGKVSDEDTWKSREKQLTEKHAADLRAQQDIVVERDRELDDVLVTAEATRSLAEAEALSIPVLLPHVKSQCKVIRVNGKPKAVVLGADGNPVLTTKVGSSDHMGIGEFVASVLKSNKDFAPFFKGNGASGTQGGNQKTSQKRDGGTPSDSGGNGNGGGTPSAVERLRLERRAQAGEA